MNYKYISLLWITLLIQPKNVSSQELLKPFNLIGKISGIDSGSFQILRIVDSNANHLKITSRNVAIKNGHFTIKGEMAYPHAFVANIYKGKKMIPTEMFFIEPGNQYLSGNYDSMIYTVPNVSSNSNHEFINEYWNRYKMIEKLSDIFQRESRIAYAKFGNLLPDTTQIRIRDLQSSFVNRRDSLMLNQAIRYPNSYISLWIFIERFFTVGYKEIYEVGFNHLSTDLKQTTTGKFLTNHINAAKVTANGQPFPDFSLTDLNGVSKGISMSGNKYTLLEFWFSHCGPCIAQFPDLKTVYKDFSDKGFNLIAISTDRTNEKNSLIAAIKKHGLPWQQLWDKNGIEANRITINSFPTNFLLDENGTIIQKNINPAALRKFLDQKLN